MARIVVYSNAYRGDVFPFVPIASDLSRRGHDVTFVCPQEFHPVFAGEPFQVAHSGSDKLAPKNLDTHAEWVAKWGMRLGGARQLKLFFGELLVPNLDDFFDALHGELQGADLLVTHPAGALVSSMVAEDLDVPWVDGDLFPMLIPTATRSPDPFPNLGETINGAAWKFGRSKLLAPLTYQKDFAAFRRKKGLDDTERSPLDAMRSPHLSLGLASPSYVVPAPDWPDTIRMTGFSIWDGPDGGTLAPEVDEFLDAGDPPVLVTLGTSAASAAPERFQMVLDELDRLGQRGIFLTSTPAIAAQIRVQPGSSQHAVWPFVPLGQVLPRCRAAVQSGAHGTNAMVLRAGIPSVTSPVLFDQVWHAKRQAELGTGLWARKPAGIGKALEKVLADDSMAVEAQRFGEQLRREDGVGAACDELEDLLTRS